MRVAQLPNDVRVPSQEPIAPVKYSSSVQVCAMYSEAILKVYRASTYCTGDIAPAVLVKELCGLSQTVRLSAGNSGTLLLL